MLTPCVDLMDFSSIHDLNREYKILSSSLTKGYMCIDIFSTFSLQM